jgi:hypothetical protein
MVFVIRNNSERRLNLGIRDGVDMVFNPKATKEVSDDRVRLYQERLEPFLNCNMLEIIEKRNPIVKDEVLSKPMRGKRMVST